MDPLAQALESNGYRRTSGRELADTSGRELADAIAIIMESMDRRIISRLDKLEASLAGLAGAIADNDSQKEIQSIRNELEDDILSLRENLCATPARPKNRPILRMSDILRDVAREHSVSVSSMKGPGRHGALVKARQDFMYRAMQAGRGCTEIGRFINRDHTTVLHGAKRHAERMK